MEEERKEKKEASAGKKQYYLKALEKWAKDHGDDPAAVRVEMKPTIKAPKTTEGILQNKQANRNNNTLGMQFGELSTNHCKEVVPYELNRKGDTGTKVTDMAVVEEANKRWKAATDKMKMAEFKNETIKSIGPGKAVQVDICAPESGPDPKKRKVSDDDDEDEESLSKKVKK